MQSVHGGVKHVCENCDIKKLQKAAFETMYNLSIMNLNIVVITVTIKGDLQKHVISVHDEVKHFCEYYDYKAATKGSFQTHVQSVHEGVKHSYDYKTTSLYPKNKNNIKWKILSVI